MLLAPGELLEADALLLGQTDQFQEFPRGSGAGAEAAVPADEFGDGQGLVQLGVLKLDTEDLAKLSAIVLRVQAQHADASAVGPAQPGDHLGRGGLARSVGPENAAHPAHLDPQAHVVHGGLAAVPFAETFHMDRRYRAAHNDGSGVLPRAWAGARTGDEVAHIIDVTRRWTGSRPADARSGVS